MRFTNFNFFHDKLGMPYIQSIEQSMMKLNINKQKICCYGHIFFAKKLFITKIFFVSVYETFFVSIYKSTQNL